MSWGAIRTGMKTVLDANLTNVQVYEVEPPSLNNGDQCVILPGDPLIEPDAHGGVDRVTILCRVRSIRGAQPDASRALDALIAATGEKSIRAAVDADPTLDGTVDGAEFLRVTAYGFLPDQPVAQADVMFLAAVDNA